MKNILVIGTGRSSSVLIEYLLNYSQSNNYFVTVLDQFENDFLRQFKTFSNFKSLIFDIHNEKLRHKEVKKSELIISMLPARFHTLIAKDCLLYKKNLITASYVSEEMNSFNKDAIKQDILMLNEIGLDPGIDHLSAMSIIDSLKSKNYNITSFKSFCGGLIAPESCDNPWGYKFTWNPRNVVLAGCDGAKYLKNGNIKEIQYNQVFKNLETVTIPNFGDFESYPNRNSLHYKEKYNLEGIQTLVRGTMRKKGFSSAWDFLVENGLTNYGESEKMFSKNDFVKKLNKIDDKFILEKINYLDINKSDFLKENSNGKNLQNILEKKWKLKDDDKDMIVMQHKFEFESDKNKKRLLSSMVVIGTDNIRTAMAKTVGLPIFFAAKLILERKTSIKGVRIPIYKELYIPILKSLEEEGINFIETIEKI